MFEKQIIWLKEKWNKFKNWVKGLLVIGTVVALAQVLPSEPVHIYQVVIWDKPTTQAEWAEDVRRESLNFKFDYQLDQMEENLTEKLPRTQKDLDKFIQCPDCIKWELKEQLNEEFLGGKLTDAVEEEYQSQLHYYKWKVDKINQSIERIKKEKELRGEGQVDRKPIGTTYYIDADCATPGDGTTATCNNDGSDSYDELDDFTEVARSAGDKAILRRSTTANYDNASDLLFTSDGTMVNPIIIEADYANAWTDDVDLSGTGTATLTFGSKTITFSADISGVLSAGDWIYAASDDAKNFSYEVATVSTVTVTLYLPYKGAQAGSGKTMTNMGDAPIWNIAAGDYQWLWSLDVYWKIQGIHIRGTDSFGILRPYNASVNEFKDVILEGNGVGDKGAYLGDSNAITSVFFDKIRVFNCVWGIITQEFGTKVYIKNSLFDGNSIASSYGIYNYQEDGTVYIEETEFKNYIYDLDCFGVTWFLRNVIVSGSIYQFYNHKGPNNIAYGVFVEDHNGVVGDNRIYSLFSTGNSDIVNKQSETTTVRSGGGNTSIKVTPSTRLGSVWEYSRLLLFEYPIYAETTSKTYTVYFKTNATADWTNDPTNSELWIEAEYWGHATNNHRRILKSTGVIDFNGSTAWQSLTVTVQPSQSGILYLRGYYAKTKEAQSNIFYVDVAPVIQ